MYLVKRSWAIENTSAGEALGDQHPPKYSNCAIIIEVKPMPET